MKVTEKKKKRLKRTPPTVDQMDAIILGGGQGTRLYPLTLTRAKPAISFGGNYRIIDVAISNAINSGCRKVFVITQFFSSSLHQHIYRTYREDSFSSGRVQMLTAEERPAKRGWFTGTADAVRQNLEYLAESSADYFLILSGDQLYNIDFKEMLTFAFEANADLTIACTPVDQSSSKRMGILRTNEDNQIIGFLEKPQTAEAVNPFKMPDSLLKKRSSSKKPFLASMGIYLFKRKALINLLEADPREDFGKHLIPTKVDQGGVSAFVYEEYWEDIGTIESFHKANIALTASHSSFNCYNDEWPLFCLHHNLPGPKISNSQLDNVIMCDGSIVDGSQIANSILGPRTVVKKGCIIKNTYVMGNDFYVPHKHSDLPCDLSVGEHTIIENAIIDKHASIGSNVKLVNKERLTDYDSPLVCIRDGIIVVQRGAAIPNGYSL